MSAQVRALLSKLYDLGGALTPRADRLVVRAPAGTLDEAFAAALREHKDALVAAVRAHRGEAEAVSFPAVAIDPDQRHEPFPLTDIQQAYWVGRSGELELGAAIHVYAEVDGELDVEALTRAWLRLVDRHEMLRAVALPDGTQRILRTRELPEWTIPVVELGELDHEDRERRLAELRGERSEAVLDIAAWPPFSMLAARLDRTRVRLFFDIDCTFVDSWAVQLLFREWVAVYRDPALALTPARFELSFRDYVLALDQPELPLFRRSQAYWDARLRELPPAPALPLACDPASVRKPKFSRWVDKLPEPEWSRLVARAHEHALTAPVLLIAAWAEVLALWSEQPEFTLNVPLFNRHPVHPEVVRLAGNFSSFTLLGVDMRAGSSFAARAGRIREQLWRDLEHRFVSGVELLRRLFRRDGGISRALMPVVFTSFASNVDGVEGSWVEYLGEELGELVYSLTQTPQVWLDHQAISQPDGCFFNWDCAVELFPEGMIDEMFACYRALLRTLATNEAAWTRPEPSLAAAWRRSVIPDKPTDTPSSAIAGAERWGARQLHDRVFAQIERTPEAIAVVSGELRLTYAELGQAARELSSQLRAQALDSRRPIAIVLDKSWRQIVAVLGVLEAGAAYLPIDPELPAARLRELLERAGVELVVTRAGLRDEADWPPGLIHLTLGATPVISISTSRSAREAAGMEPGGRRASDVAAVIFTSGSTGTPNAAMLTHAGLINAIDATIERFAVGPQDVCLALTALHHDMSIFDIFAPLSVGGRVVIPEPWARRDPGRWVELMLGEGVRIWNSVPTMLEMLAAWLEARPEHPRPASLRLAFTGGDWIPIALPERLWALLDNPDLELVSVGGPTETTLWNIWHRIDAVDPAWTSIPYGTELPNTRYYVMAEGPEGALIERPTWVPGELVCAGVGVALGYLGDPERSAAKFVTHPQTGARLYRTGDRGRRLGDGTIEFLGRIDDQLSIGGHRIEPAEIEAVLLRRPELRACAVVGAGPRDGKVLVAHVVPVAGAEVDPSALQAELERRLPAAMVVRVFVVCDALPITRNGKIDRRRLAAIAPVLDKSAAVSIPEPRERSLATPELRATLEAIVRDVVGVDEVDPDANFFELGAHSVHLVRIHAQLHRRLGVELPLVDLFRHPTLRFLAEHLSRTDAAAHERARLEARTQARVEHASQTEPAGIAIVGMAGRFPGAPDLRRFWANIEAGRETLRRFEPEELRAAGIPEQVFTAPDYVPVAGVLDDIEGFDPALFGISEAEARLLDPQNRILLENAWEALEDAGWAGDRGSMRVGVYAGKSISNYLFPALDLAEPVDYFKRLFGNDKDFIATGISYRLNLRGPSIAVHTACSTSAVAVALACQALRAGDCDMALAGGVSIKLPHHAGYRSIPGDGMFAPDGRCRPFDADGRGIVPGSGSGVVALRRLDDALRDGDQIYAVIRGWATNNDGGHKVGFTAPDVDGQAEVVASAQRLAGIRAEQVGYVEAHGTGTPIGDPIEVEALTQAFSLTGGEPGQCVLGSVKALIGHLDAAAGIAGLIKAALVLDRRTLPPSTNFARPNPRIDFARTPFVSAARARPWQAPRRIAGVSSFGVGGTNVHLVLEQAPEPAPAPSCEGPVLVALSARSDEALVRVRERLAAALGEDDAPALTDVGSTCNVGRHHWPRRNAWIGRESADLRAALGSGHTLIRSRRPPSAERRVAWLFSGFGDQRVGMGAELHEHEPVFRASFDECAALVAALSKGEVALAGLLDTEHDVADRLERELRFAQLGVFALEWSLAQLWRSWGFVPDVVMGHSLGECVAACVAGVFELPDALRLVAARAELVAQRAEPGETHQIKASRAELEALLADHEDAAQIASDNGPTSVIVSGRPAAMRTLVDSLHARGVETRMISSGHAAHSPLMEPVLEPLAAVAEGLRYASPQIDMVCNLTGALAGPELATPEYWVRQLREPVRLSTGFTTLHETLGVETFVEFGPAPALLWTGMQCVAKRSGLWIPTLRPPRSERKQMLHAVAQLYVDGATVDWAKLHEPQGPRGGRRVSLPTYPFERERFWLDEPTPAIWPATLRSQPGRTEPPRNLLGEQLDSPAFDGARVWETVLDPQTRPWLNDHRAHGVALLPGAAFAELARAAATQVLGASVELRELSFERPLALAGPHRLQTVVRETEAGLAIEFHGQGARSQERGWVCHARASVFVTSGEILGFDRSGAATDVIDLDHHYAALDQEGSSFGPCFRGLKALWRGPEGLLAQVVAPAGVGPHQGWHPAVLDACLQVAGLALRESEAESELAEYTNVVASIGSLRAATHPGSTLWVRAGTNATDGFDLDAIDDDGRPVLAVRDLSFRRVRSSTLEATLGEALEADRAVPIHALRWIPASLPAASPGPERWVIVGEVPGLARALARAGQACTVVQTPAAALTALSEHEHRPGLIFAGARPSLAASVGAEALLAAQRGSCGVLLELIAGLLELPAARRAASLWIISVGARHLADHDAAALDPTGLAQSPLWGLAGNLTVEHPELRCRAVDLDPALPCASQADALSSVLLGSGDEARFALRGGQLAIERLVALAERARTEARTQLDGAWLLAGATGRVGRRLALWLAERGATTLWLVARTLADATLQRELEALGCEVRALALDLGRDDAPARLLAALDDQPLTGIIHAAGVVADGPIATMDWPRFVAPLHAKLAVAWNLTRVADARGVKRLLLLSSSAASLAEPGQANYAAANLFVDELARRRSHAGSPTLAPAFGPWTGAEAAVDDARLLAAAIQRGLRPRPAEAYLSALERSLDDADEPAPLLADPNWTKRITWLGRNRLARALLEALPDALPDALGTPAPAILRAELDALPPRRRREHLIARVRSETAAILGIDDAARIGSSRGFVELGLDSLAGLELRNRLQESTGVELPIATIYAHPTVAQLGDHLAHELGLEREAEPASDDPNPALDQLGGHELAARLAAVLDDARPKDLR